MYARVINIHDETIVDDICVISFKQNRLSSKIANTIEFVTKSAATYFWHLRLCCKWTTPPVKDEWRMERITQPASTNYCIIALKVYS